MHAEILAIGDEVISGRILDTNTQWLSRRLEDQGIRVLYHSAVGDEMEALADCFARAISRADLVIATGGLGPTADDLTREALSKAVQRKLVCNDDALQHIRALFARRKREMPQSNELQAWLPEGAQVVHNPDGTAPGIDLEAPRAGKSPCRVIVLPGVPAEMRQMWDGSVAAILRKMGAGAQRIVHKQVKCFGAGESQIESLLPAGFVRQTDPIVGITASQATISLRIAAHGASDEACRAKMAPIINVIRRSLGDLVFGEDDDELQTVVLRLLVEKNKTLATAEWGTGGLMADWFGACENHRSAYAGGIVITSAASLCASLAIDDALLGRHADDANVAKAMALAVRKSFGADYGLAVGRFPDAVAAAGEAPPVYLALASDGEAQVKQLPFALHPDLLRTYFAKHAMNMARLKLL